MLLQVLCIDPDTPLADIKKKYRQVCTSGYFISWGQMQPCMYVHMHRCICLNNHILRSWVNIYALKGVYKLDNFKTVSFT